jgi:hypothetical protein
VTFRKGKKYSQKHSQKDTVDPAISRIIQDRAEGRKISCKNAFDIAEELSAPIDKIGKNIDLLNIKLIKCQLGLFGYKPNKKKLQPLSAAAPELKEAIIKALVDGKLPCSRAWAISSQFNVSKIMIGSTCEFLGVKINDCQLGAF